MRGTRQNVMTTAILVAKAGCARLGREVGVASVIAALGLLVGLGTGCSMSHGTSGVDRDGDGHDSDVDCNDEDASIYPGAPEGARFPDCCATPAIDYDCDGMPLICSCNPIPDWDGDGYLSHEDCNDGDASIYPGAFEDECATDGIDRNCDGVPPGPVCNFLPDADGDGYFAGDDCDDSDARVNPGATDDVCPDGVDQDCDGEDAPPDPLILCTSADADGDGVVRFYDCDDSDPNVHPGARELDTDCADGIDQNCDGVDNGIICNGMADPPEDDDVDWSRA